VFPNGDLRRSKPRRPNSLLSTPLPPSSGLSVICEMNCAEPREFTKSVESAAPACPRCRSVMSLMVSRLGAANRSGVVPYPTKSSSGCPFGVSCASVRPRSSPRGIATTHLRAGSHSEPFASNSLTYGTEPGEKCRVVECRGVYSTLWNLRQARLDQ